MKKIYTFLLILVLLFSCGVAKNTPSDSPQSHMFTQIEQVYTIDQFDSLCFADRIHRNLDKWGSTNFIDDKGGLIKEYLYIVKRKGERDTTMTYTVIEESDSTFFVNKRITIE